jgi:hypothetical protein
MAGGKSIGEARRRKGEWRDFGRALDSARPNAHEAD